MKILPYLVIAAALTSSAIAAPKTILVDAQVVELATNDDALPKDLSKIAEKKGADVLTFPRQKTASGRAVKLSAALEAAIPHQGAVKPGVIMTVRPTLAGDGRIRYSVDFDFTRFAGFFAPSSSEAPIFSTTRAAGIEGTAEIGQPVVLSLDSWNEKQIIKEPGKPGRAALVYRRLIAVLTFSKGR